MRLCRELIFGLVVLGCGVGARAQLTVAAHSSLPGAPATLYLQFGGDSRGTTIWDTYTPGNTPAYDVDGNAGSFSTQELSNIDQIWARVAEKYSPFNINVTTVDPGVYNNLQATRVVVGGDGAWTNGVAGGISNYFSFSNSEENLGFVFSQNLKQTTAAPPGDPKKVAEAIAHEAGHGFGLYHQSVWRDAFPHFLLQEYNPGTAEKAPIMGNSYAAARGLWWYGMSQGYNVFQDDMAVVASTTGANANMFGYRPDDHANAAVALGIQDVLTIAPDLTVSAHGVIETTSDQDWFSFHTDGGDATIVVDVAPFGPMLDLSFNLYDANNLLLGSRATSSLGEWMEMGLAVGDYRLQVLSVGNYGDVGQYFISGTLVPEPGGLAIAVLYALWMRRGRRKA
jgi:hypothetical protein